MFKNNKFFKLILLNLTHNRIKTPRKYNKAMHKDFLPLPILLQISDIIKKNQYNIYGFKRISNNEIEFATNCVFDSNYDETNVSEFSIIFDGKFPHYITNVDDLLYFGDDRFVVRKTNSSKIHTFSYPKLNYQKPILTSEHMRHRVIKEYMNKGVTFPLNTENYSANNFIDDDILKKIYTIILKNRFSICGWKRINDNEFLLATNCSITTDTPNDKNINKYFAAFTGETPLYIQCLKDFAFINTNIVKLTPISKVITFQFPLIKKEEEM